MARFNMEDADRYGGQGGTGYFSLKNDKDVARVRFLYNNMNDVEGIACHQVEVGDKKRYVNCLRESYNSPISDCPFCEAKKFQVAKLFIPLYNIDEDKIQVWERGKKFFAKISSICARYASNASLVSHTFEIERNGAKGDNSTSYEIYETGQDDTQLSDFELPEIIGRVVLDKSASDMENYLSTGVFPESSNSSDTGVRRRSESDEGVSRRTPSRRGDAF